MYSQQWNWVASFLYSSYIHVSVSNKYIPKIGLPTWLQQKGRPILGIYKYKYVNVEVGRQHIIILFRK